MEYIYCDAAATTPVSSEVLAEMIPYLTTDYGNPSSQHSLGELSRDAILRSRHIIANILGCKDSEIIFTSGATESNNMALKLAKKHIITSSYEHHSILNPIKASGIKATYLPVYDNGIVKAEDVINSITPDTDMVSIMAVNNELGTVNPIENIAKICKKQGILFHTDATQYIGHGLIPLLLDNIDLLSFSGHKFGAPKGIGVLYVKEGTNIQPLIYGGQQENGLRGGTENVPYIVGIAKALEIVQHKKINFAEIEDKLLDELLKIPGTKLNGDLFQRSHNIINISIDGIKGEMLAYTLNQYGIAVSTGSACASESNEPSHVLKAIGLSDDEANSSLRISFNNDVNIEYVAKTIKAIVELMRED